MVKEMKDSLYTKFISRKFFLAVFASVVSTVALFTIDFTGSMWIASQSIILGMYGTSNIANKYTEHRR